MHYISYWNVNTYTWCFLLKLGAWILVHFPYFVHCALVRCHALLAFFILCIVFLFFNYVLKGDCGIPSDAHPPYPKNIFDWNIPILSNRYTYKGQNLNSRYDELNIIFCCCSSNFCSRSWYAYFAQALLFVSIPRSVILHSILIWTYKARKILCQHQLNAFHCICHSLCYGCSY